MLMTDCKPNTIDEAGDGKAGEIVLLLERRRRPRSTMKAKIAMMTQAEHDAELLAGDREDEVGMAVGQEPLDGALARPDAEPAAAG